MSDANGMKVFEFAKELGLAPLALMDKIRSWDMPVKSHMSDLTPEQMLEIKRKLGLLGEEPADGAIDKKAKTTSKSVRKRKATAEAPPTLVKSVRGREDEEKKAEEPQADSSSEAAKTTKVVRRRRVAGEEGAMASTEGSEVAQTLSSTPGAQTPGSQEIPSKSDANTLPIEATMSARSSDTVAKLEPLSASGAESNLVEKPQNVATATSSVTGAATPGAARESSPSGSTPGLGAPSAVTESASSGLALKRKEVTIGQSGVASQPSAAATQVKRNIVGRMDLSRVQGMGNTAGASGGRGPMGSGSERRGPGAGPGGGLMRSKGNLRAGFVAAASFMPDARQLEEEEEERRREERRREKAREAAAAAKEGEEPPQFDASEFKKRELVFQPKKKTNLLNRPALKTQITVAAQHKRVLKVPGSMKLSEVAHEMGVKLSELTKVLMKNGVMATPATELDFETLALVLPELGWEAQNAQKTPEELLEAMAFGDLTAEPVSRPPVVTIMGHVDHGKTSLLDAIRKTNVAAGEAGGITQHIGAYQVSLEDGYKITFLDTPGHEAFTAMRSRGAHVTDIAVIVVAADDGVMPQTAEAISHAKAARVPIIVAVNKMDKPGANPDRVMQQLTEYEIVPEEWGGDTIFVKVSALTRQGLPDLLEQIRLLAEVNELRANPKRSGTGVVIEAKLDKGRGPVATLLVRDGTVKVGQWIVAGMQKGRVRSLHNDRGEKLNEALPGQPVELLGLDGVPSPGDRFDIVKDEKAMDEVVSLRERIAKAKELERKQNRLENLFAKLQAGATKELPLVLKADVHGSLEALLGMVEKLGNQEVKVKVIHSAVGGITESDVLLATTSQAIIIGFNVRPDAKATQLAKNNQVDVRTYSIVYELMDDLKKALSGLLQPQVVETVLGHAEVRNTFTVSKVGTVAGCYVTDGKVTRGALVRLLRDGKIVYEGKLSSLKRFKDDVREVASGFECGLGIENYNDIKVGDVIEAYLKEEKVRSLDDLGGTATASSGKSSSLGEASVNPN